MTIVRLGEAMVEIEGDLLALAAGTGLITSATGVIASGRISGSGSACFTGTGFTAAGVGGGGAMCGWGVSISAPIMSGASARSAGLLGAVGGSTAVRVTGALPGASSITARGGLPPSAGRACVAVITA